MPANYTVFFNLPHIKAIIKSISNILCTQIKNGVPIFPPLNKVFASLYHSSNIKVLILGHEPYPDERDDGFAYSIESPKIPLTQTLKTIFEECENSYIMMNNSPCLNHWIEQGVLLLNSSLTSEVSTTTLWNSFTKDLLTWIHTQNPNIIALLFGPKLADFADMFTHKIITCDIEDKKFVGSNCFLNVNKILKTSRIYWDRYT